MTLNNNYTIIWSPNARKKLQEIYNYIREISKESKIAKNVTDKILNSICDLRYFPERNVKIFTYENKSRNLRRCIIDNYIIIYEVNQNKRSGFYITHIS